MDPIQELAGRIRTARGEDVADLLLTGGRIVDVFSGEMLEADVAVSDGIVVGFGEYRARETLSLAGKVLVPGFIDAHMHLESSMVTPDQYARAVVPRGTTTIVIDPHEIANVKGLDGIRYMLGASRGLPLDVNVMVPSCVPATGMETSGARLEAQDLATLSDPRIRGLAEVMDFPAVVHGEAGMLRKIRMAAGGRIDGHSPGLSGKELCAYLTAGVESDHECTTAEEALEKLRLGMHIFMREGSATRDLEALLPIVRPERLSRIMLCTDDREPADLLNEGHIDFVLRKAMRLGCYPPHAFTMATLSPAEYFRLGRVGAIAPGYRADLVVLDDLREVRVSEVFKDGKLVARDGVPLWESAPTDSDAVRDTVRIAPLGEEAFRIPARGLRAHVIGLIPQKIVTEHLVEDAPVSDQEVVADPGRDLLKLAVVERHHATGRIGLGLVRGFGIRRGALASTVGHDSHNLILVGADDASMRQAAGRIVQLGGGWVAVAGGKVLAELALPIGGLMSDRPLEEVKNANERLYQATLEMGGTTPNPFMSLSFLALPVVPALKLTDRGLVDVEKFQLIDLFT
ncbi:MAG: adenine deaminase [Armatimonadetes bacterium]|nr:adenine deaminase [Armatimonadota bacterium]